VEGFHCTGVLIVPADEETFGFFEDLFPAGAGFGAPFGSWHTYSSETYSGLSALITAR